ncbi:hypothetical protein NEUTE2DRAFT_60252 [Neurospora tetrasperma FGSC 2509]|nr:hypothetical protein NEUTE2DRAFT_60252 [Neurospora tetrasperma FGSC 2509]
MNGSTQAYKKGGISRSANWAHARVVPAATPDWTAWIVEPLRGKVRGDLFNQCYKTAFPSLVDTYVLIRLDSGLVVLEF